eukprot:TRINITY_DN960_c0_g1_i2.p1 TRINITY_DN960_c0_g1~~TRINITY_DN960_c0_g1_i2.p1  ORF type:complete len:1435 (+),score=415.08 TRINITY_DN960_c0_g1_i2:46-4350(+)
MIALVVLAFAAFTSAQVPDPIVDSTQLLSNVLCGNVTTASGAGCGDLEALFPIDGDEFIPCDDILNAISDELCEIDFNGDPEFDAAAFAIVDGGLLNRPTNDSNTPFAPLEDGTLPFIGSTVIGFLNDGGVATFKVSNRDELNGGNAVNGTEQVITQNNDYLFSVEVCTDSDAGSSAELRAVITDVDGSSSGITAFFAGASPFESDPDLQNDAAAGNGTCATLTVRVPHYELFSSIGVNGLSLEIANTGTTGQVFFGDVTISAIDRIAGGCTDVFINEVNYNDTAFDGMTLTAFEAIEIAGPANTDLSGYSLELIDFGDSSVPDQTASYLTVSFGAGEVTPILRPSPTTQNDGQFGFFVVKISQDIMDGDGVSGVDGIILRDETGAVVQFLCYGTGVDEDAFITANAAAGAAGCDTVVLSTQNVAAEDTTLAGSVQAVGCGSCREHFDFEEKLANTLTNNGTENTGGAVEQLFCSDKDADGFWDGVQQGNAASGFGGLIDQAGLINITFGNACCGGNDCHDNYPHIHPNAEEICDGFDTSCSLTDYAAASEDIVMPDSELDTDGDGRVPCDNDCVDTDATIFGAAGSDNGLPLDDAVFDHTYFETFTAGDASAEAIERCDSLDNNCDILVDNNAALDGVAHVIHFEDADFDGFADASIRENETVSQEFANCLRIDENCTVLFPRGFAQQRTDCDDSNDQIRPDFFGNVHLIQFANGTTLDQDTQSSICNVAELCDKTDQNCNEQIDEGIFIDEDGDGFSVNNETTCVPDYGVENVGTDCHDDPTEQFLLDRGIAAADVNPNATELCDRVDNNCDGFVDEDLFIDIDEDGFSRNFNENCTAEYGERFVGTDCQDDPSIDNTNFTDGSLASPSGQSNLNASQINPDAFEDPCDGVDNDCSDFIRADGNFTFDVEDTLNDSDEVCDGLDNDCDDVIDNGILEDIDGDGHFAFYNNFGVENCTTEALDNVNNQFLDCFDLQGGIPGAIHNASLTHPGAKEVCDGVDNNCEDGANGLAANHTVVAGSGGFDTGFTIDEENFFDADIDNRFASPTSFQAVVEGSNDFASSECIAINNLLEDCNDNNDSLTTFSSGLTNASQTEVTCNRIDDNCNGETDEDMLIDLDGDGFFQGPNGGDLPDSCSSLGLDKDCYDTPEQIEEFNTVTYGSLTVNMGLSAGDLKPDADEVPCDNIDNNCAGGSAIGDFAANVFDSDSDGALFSEDSACKARIESQAGADRVDCNDNSTAERPCLDEERENGVCLRELLDGFRGTGFGDGLDNDCNDQVDDRIKDAVELFLTGEKVLVTSTVGDDDDDSTSSSENSNGCTADLVFSVVLKANVGASSANPDGPTNVIIKGQLDLPPRVTPEDFILGDLSNFGIEIHRNTFRVTWVQFQMQGLQQEVIIPICLRRASDADLVKLELSVTNVDQLVVGPTASVSI